MNERKEGKTEGCFLSLGLKGGGTDLWHIPIQSILINYMYVS